MTDRFKNNDRVCYVTLDCILDTRLGCLQTYFPHIFKDETKVMEMYASYHSRIYEGFSDVSVANFRQAYLKRDKSVLAKSIVTNIINELITFAINVQKQNVSTNDKGIPVLEVNTYPYELTDKELELIAVAIRIHTCNELNVRMVNIAPKDLTPTKCVKNYVMMFMYDYSEWLDIHSSNGNFERNPTPELTVIVPKVWLNDEFDHEAFKVMRKGRTMEDTIEVIASVWLDLHMLPIGLFSFNMSYIK